MWKTTGPSANTNIIPAYTYRNERAVLMGCKEMFFSSQYLPTDLQDTAMQGMFDRFILHYPFGALQFCYPSSQGQWIWKDGLAGSNDFDGAEAMWPAIHTAAEYLGHFQLPQNYFYYTPLRGLSGLGEQGSASNNYDGVGHPHGVTNQFTVLGGTNFPAGRTAWYTTDYGLEGMTGIVSKLVWQKLFSRSVQFYPAVWYINITYLTTHGQLSYYGYGEGTSFALAKNAAIASYGLTQTLNDNSPAQKGTSTDRNWRWHPNYRAWMGSSTYVISNTWVMSSLFGHTVQYYGGPTVRYDPYDQAYDAQGTAFSTEGRFYKMWESEETTNELVLSDPVGSSDPTTITWSDSSEEGYGDGLGYQINLYGSGCAIVKWDGTNGFKYK